MIGKWLNAGVMEAGNGANSEQGTPQGGVISPLLSNIYLHEVLDSWVVKTVQPLLKGKSFMVRYADDAIIGCEKKEDADRIMKVLALRFAKYGLTIHPEKTKLVDFTKPAGESHKGSGNYTFLGFKHYWTKSRKGRWMVGRKTDGKRLSRALKAITQWCRENRHTPKKEQHEKLRGHYAYYGISLNYDSIAQLYHQVKRIWFKWLNRRSRQKELNWEQFGSYLQHVPLPQPKIVHSYC
ncbi:MAG: hypothetical protein LBU17_00470 [Treponema sp.]|nr:hypothetical protein [Treponema sp.]